jgi:hypothetical protein
MLAGAARIIRETVPISSSPEAMSYLQKTRKIDVAAIEDVLERVDALGWHPAVYFHSPEHELHGQRLGALIGVMTDPVTSSASRPSASSTRM